MNGLVPPERFKVIAGADVRRRAHLRSPGFRFLTSAPTACIIPLPIFRVDSGGVLGDKRVGGYEWSVAFSNLWQREADQMIAAQIEFPLTVAICAWCKPQDEATAAGTLSHGICLKHLRKLKLQARGGRAKRPSGGRQGSAAPVPSLGL